MSNSFKVGTFRKDYNKILETNYPLLDIRQSYGLSMHLIKQNHQNCLDYLRNITKILNYPNYIGQNSRHANSIELIKVYDEINILVAIKLDNDKGYWYIASVYGVSLVQINRRIHSGRLKKISKNTEMI